MPDILDILNGRHHRRDDRDNRSDARPQDNNHHDDDDYDDLEPDHDAPDADGPIVNGKHLTPDDPIYSVSAKDLICSAASWIEKKLRNPNCGPDAVSLLGYNDEDDEYTNDGVWSNDYIFYDITQKYWPHPFRPIQNFSVAKGIDLLRYYKCKFWTQFNRVYNLIVTDSEEFKRVDPCDCCKIWLLNFIRQSLSAYVLGRDYKLREDCLWGPPLKITYSGKSTDCKSCKLLDGHFCPCELCHLRDIKEDYKPKKRDDRDDDRDEHRGRGKQHDRDDHDDHRDYDHHRRYEHDDSHSDDHGYPDYHSDDHHDDNDSWT